MLLEISRQRAKNEKQENNLMSAANAAEKDRQSSMINVNPEAYEREMKILDGIIKKEESHA